MKKNFIYLSLLFTALLTACGGSKSTDPRETTELRSPVIPGYFADPSIVQHEGKFYMYATADPWGAEFLSCWVSDDFQNWTFHQLNWPTKALCTSPTSNENNVWAPSVVKKGDTFYMYTSVGSEVWCGKAKHPLGPWENMMGDQPMLSFDTTRFYHVIDAEAFIDDDGKAYLYWGSGWDWINGHCYAAELNDDMHTFKTEPKEVTPSHYFEGPLMIKHDSKYYLTYSEGKTIDETYEVRYAVGDTPLGPFTEAKNSPVLKTADSLSVYGPGHHTIMSFEGKNYIVYHRHSLPFNTGTALRQICINELEFDGQNGQIKNITPYSVQSFPKLSQKEVAYIQPASVSASSEKEGYTAVKNLTDNDFSTLWKASETDESAWVKADFNPDTFIKTMEIRFEYPWKDYFIKVESSADGNTWETIADHTEKGISGSPVNIDINKKASFIRIVFTTSDKEPVPAIWDLFFY
ncbi:family 43 glycosylhydrolase [uncultured Dysgonomonas sp.]|uniref:F5/8 type C domain-containing protein n=1 Tax=uncultured Dysgonomonas sp. TaxID=206096 RepID=A0A212K4I1_9BACT|nr:family 43 glycosylhydrolase [uncultured Dysgonomonas sp.]SBW06405.1 conserved exported hypothetical protein [uncultured Dysgonomonas sp.]